MTIDGDNVFAGRQRHQAGRPLRQRGCVSGRRQRAKTMAVASSPVLSLAKLVVLPECGTMAAGCRGRRGSENATGKQKRSASSTWYDFDIPLSYQRFTEQLHSLLGIPRTRHVLEDRYYCTVIIRTLAFYYPLVQAYAVSAVSAAHLCIPLSTCIGQTRTFSTCTCLHFPEGSHSAPRSDMIKYEYSSGPALGQLMERNNKIGRPR